LHFSFRVARFCSYRALLIVGLSLAALATAAEPAAPYPVKPVRLIIPYPAGGGNDIMGRAVAERLSERLGQQVVIDNRGGASTVIGAEIAARAPKDGYTLMLAPNTTLAIIPNMRTNLPYDPIKDYEPISLVSASPYLLLVNPGFPVVNVKELIALAKSKPGQINYASPGHGTSNHLAAELFKTMTGADLIHVPYKGTAQAVTDLLGGHVSVMFAATAAVRPYVITGRLRALGISTAKRNPAVPDIPTIAESGVPGYHAASWVGMVAPRGTPRPVTEKLNAALAAVIGEADLRQRLSAQGFDPEASTPDQFAAHIRSELNRYGKVIKAARITVE
jgi:tripartite-type tricarboxylate transporter receptor subunit TctC